jgi:DNA-binding transcriptional ArsR family regulator
MVALSEGYYVTKAAITSPIDRLEEMGLVERRGSEEDRRTILVEITEQRRNLPRPCKGGAEGRGRDRGAEREAQPYPRKAQQFGLNALLP